MREPAAAGPLRYARENPHTCILVLIGATADGRKELPAVHDGVREHLDPNRSEDAELARKEAELERPFPDVESLLPLAERVLTDPAGLWREASGEARLVFQRFLLPEGVPFDGESFGTAVTSPLFSRLRAWECAKGRW